MQERIGQGHPQAVTDTQLCHVKTLFSSPASFFDTVITGLVSRLQEISPGVMVAQYRKSSERILAMGAAVRCAA